MRGFRIGAVILAVFLLLCGACPGQAEDIWYLSLAETNLTSILNADGYPAGVYRVAFYVDGLLADEFSFELK